MWSVQCGVYSVECTVWNVKWGVYSVECTVWNVKWGVYSVECKVWSVGVSKTNSSCETSSNFETLTTSKRKGFVASPIETAKPEESQRLKQTYVRA